MDAQRVRQLADRFIDCLTRLENGDVASADKLAAMFADDAELTNPAIQHKAPPRRGSEEIKRFWRSYSTSFREIHSEFVEVTASERAAGLFWKSKGVNAEDKPVAYDGVSLLVFDDAGRIKKFHGYYNTRQIEGDKPVGNVGSKGYG